MSIIQQQMTAIHLRTALRYLTYTYLADLTLSNANLALFPLGTGIPPCAPTVYQIGKEKERHTSRKKLEYMDQQPIICPRQRKRLHLNVIVMSLSLCRDVYALNRIEEGMLKDMSEPFQTSLHMGFNIKMGDTLKLYFREDDITKEITSPYSCHYLPKSVCWPASGQTGSFVEVLSWQRIDLLVLIPLKPCNFCVSSRTS